jgi:hypothetical protein
MIISKDTREVASSKKLQFTYPWAFVKDVQDTEEAFSPQTSTSKQEISSVVDPGFFLRIRIFPSRIQGQKGTGSRVKTVPDPGSGTKNLSICNPKIFTKLLDIPYRYDTGCLFRSWILGPGSQV